MAGDQQAAAIGQACLSPGETKATYGTGVFVLTHTGRGGAGVAQPAADHGGLADRGRASNTYESVPAEARSATYCERALRNATGAIAVDMESHVAAAFAAQHRLPFAAVRVVCDPAHRALPALVESALRPDGGVSLTGVLASLCRRPLQLLAMPGLARDAAEGFRALRRCRELLGHGLGIGHAGECEIKAAV